MDTNGFSIETRAGTAFDVVSPSGRIILGEAARELKRTLEEMEAGGCRPVILNLARVPYVDSAGLGVIAAAFRRHRDAGAALLISNVQPRVQNLLELTRLAGVIAAFETEEDAARSLARA